MTHPAVRECVYDAATAFAVDYTDVLSRKRTKAIAYARIAACALLRERYSWSTVEIGKALGRDHTTVISNLRRAEQNPVARVVRRLMNQSWKNISDMAWNAYVGDRGESSDVRHENVGTLPMALVAEWRRRMVLRKTGT